MADIVGIMLLAMLGLIVIFLLFAVSGSLMAKSRIEGFLTGGIVFALTFAVIMFSIGWPSKKQREEEAAKPRVGKVEIGCFNPFFVAYEKAILTGSVGDIEIAAGGIIDYEIEGLLKRSGGYFLQGERPDRETLLSKLVSTDCKEGRDALLIAVLAGNIEATQWLLEKGAAPMALEPSTDPKFPAGNIFSRCDYRPASWSNKYPFDNEDVRRRRVETYRLVIQAGGNPDMPLHSTIGDRHSTAMDICKDVSLLELFQKHRQKGAS
jgi:hypothetical protein